MKQERLDTLADSIFAIVMTLLVIELKVPQLPSAISNIQLWNAIQTIYPVFISYLLSFAVLFTYWRSHHFISSVYAKNIDLKFTTINALFLFFVALIPFSAHLLGRYTDTQLAIAIYGLNVICIGLSLLWMRSHVFRSKTIMNLELKPREKYGSTIRLLLPVICAIAAIALSFYNTLLSIILFTFAIIFNLFAKSTSLIIWFLEKMIRIKSK